MPIGRQFLGVLVLVVLTLFGTVPPVKAAGNASLYLSPSTGSFLVGSTFDVSIVLNTKGDAINLIESELFFPRDKIQITNPSVGKSLVEVWAVPPTFSNQDGRIYFVGGVPSPGITTSNGVILTMTFRVIAPGDGEIRFTNRTRVLANDGAGTDVLGQATPSSFSFRPTPPGGPQVSSPTHPDQTSYYKNTNPSLIWTKDGAQDFSYAVDQDPNGVPDTRADTSETAASFETLEDGIWYFHVRARKNGVWGGTSSFILNIDTTPPAAYAVQLASGRRTTEERPIARFFTTDSRSGLDHYELKIIPLAKDASADTAFFFEVTSPYQFTPLSPGRYTVLVRAFDRAGNWRDAEETVTVTRTLFPFANTEGLDLVLFFVPWTILLNILFLLVLLLILATTWFWYNHRSHIHSSLKSDTKAIKSVIQKNLRNSISSSDPHQTNNGAPHNL
jgi:hypothetical protein